MQKKLSLPTKKIKEWIRKNKAIDVIAFGSFARGKIKPNDIDMCVLINDSDEKRSLDIVGSLMELGEDLKLKLHVSILTSRSFFKGNTLTKTILEEGYSIQSECKFSIIFGFNSKSLFIYSLKHFSPSKRVSFHYILRGRYGTEGALRSLHGSFLGTGSILIPAENEDLLKEIFDKWQAKYEIKRVLIG